MQIPFTLQQFIAVFTSYNEAVFPWQLIFYGMGVLAIYFTIKPGLIPTKVVSGILSFLWLWMGFVYHLVFFVSINKAAYLFGSMFILQGVLFLIFGIFKNAFLFEFQKDKYGLTGMGLILFSLIFYPVLSYFLGHVYPAAPTFGLPCPTTIFTFGLLLLNREKCPLFILIIPFIWSLIGFMAALQFGFWEDTSLLMASLVTVSLLIYRNKTL